MFTTTSNRDANINSLKGSLHLWMVDISLTTHEDAESFRVDLSADELREYEKIKPGSFKKEKMTSRYCLRKILSSYVGGFPKMLEIKQGAFGKPYLAKHRSQIKFNVAHSGDFVLIAVGTDREIGIDIEKHRPDLLDEDLTTAVLSSKERVNWEQGPVDLRVKTFFDLWTGKEALLKAEGRGLSGKMHQLPTRIGFDDEEWLNVEDAKGADLKLVHLNLIPGYSVAMATVGTEPKVGVMNFKIPLKLLKQSHSGRGV